MASAPLNELMTDKHKWTQARQMSKPSNPAVAQSQPPRSAECNPTMARLQPLQPSHQNTSNNATKLISGVATLNPTTERSADGAIAAAPRRHPQPHYVAITTNKSPTAQLGQPTALDHSRPPATKETCSPYHTTTTHTGAGVK